MDKIDTIRAFNRFYTNQIGIVGAVGLGGLSYTEARVLFEIGSQEEPNARELVSLLALDEGYVSRVIRALERRKLIERFPSADDGRVKILRLTKEGQIGHDTLVRRAKDAVKEMISGLPNATIDQLLETLVTAQGILSWPQVPKPEIREIGPGDVGWVIKRHGELYAASEGFDISFEALVAKIMSEFIEKRQTQMEKGWIANSQDLRLGCVFVVADDASTARLRLMLVEPFARGKGVGQLLIGTAINHARSQGFDKMVLWTEQGFEAACRLYARNGFKLRDSQSDQMFGRQVINQTWELEL